MTPHSPPRIVLTNTLPLVRLYLSKSSWLTASRVYPTHGCCSSASQLSHWRRAPVASLEVFLLQSTQSKWLRSYLSVIIINYPPQVPHILPPSSRLPNLGSRLLSLSMFASRTWSNSYRTVSIFTLVLGCRFSTSSAKARQVSRVSIFILFARQPLTTHTRLGTDNIIERLIRIAVETASIGAIFCVCDPLSSIRSSIHTFRE